MPPLLGVSSNLLIEKDFYMKICPYCAEEIQDAAIKCKHCGEFLDGQGRSIMPGNTIPWYYRTTFIVIALCCVGPLALPLLWFCPQASRPAKAIWTAIILLATYASIIAMSKLMGTIEQFYQQMNAF